jgi:hypothetical protein
VREPLNFGTFARCNSAFITFRLIGFGVMLYNMASPLADRIDPNVGGLPVSPCWRLGFVSPWQ